MGEAKRRRDYERAHADEIAADPAGRMANYAWSEEIVSEDPDDRADRIAHGLTYEDNWQDPSVVCRNGCGLTYADIVSGKIRTCAGSAA